LGSACVRSVATVTPSRRTSSSSGCGATALSVKTDATSVGATPNSAVPDATTVGVPGSIRTSPHSLRSCTARCSVEGEMPCCRARCLTDGIGNPTRSLPSGVVVEPPVGIEPTTFSLRGGTTPSHRPSTTGFGNTVARSASEISHAYPSFRATGNATPDDVSTSHPTEVNSRLQQHAIDWIRRRCLPTLRRIERCPEQRQPPSAHGPSGLARYGGEVTRPKPCEQIPSPRYIWGVDAPEAARTGRWAVERVLGW
jgi:hypothetical protein